MNFREAESYLLSLGNEVEAMKLGLENIRVLLTGLGKPAIGIPKVQIAGTNGKGSVCAFLNSICLEAGIKSGLFSSPHLVSITERIRISGQEISENEFADLASFVRSTSEWLVERGDLETLPTYFEQVTATALVAFANHAVELVILETGLGGRLDATTAANAEIAAITRIDLDHQEYLGETIAEIAAEKAAIIHVGAKVVIGEQADEPMQVILDQCERLEIEPRSASQVRTTNFPPVRGGVPDGRGGGSSGWLNFETDQGNYRVGRLGLLGRHQIENAKVPILLAEMLQEHFSISPEHIVTGLKKARHPGRLEYQGRYLFDGAHNVGGAKVLAAYLDEFETRPITMIFGAMEGKDVGEMAKTLFSKAENVILTQPDNSRAISSADLAALTLAGFERDRCILTRTVGEALENADRVAGADSIILITGSLYLVGEAKRILKHEPKI